MTRRMLTLVLTLSIAILAVCLERTVAAGRQLSVGPVTYKEGGQELNGYLAYDAALLDKRPGILIVHEWWGLNDYPKSRAQQLAGLGYVAFAADIYGSGAVATNQEAAAKLAAPFRADRELMRRRVTAALAVLKADPRVDPKRVAAIGYCFGATCVLELARDGADLAGVVSFHGGLDTPHPDSTPKPKAAILVCHGANDAYVTPESVESFWREMKQCGADWQLNVYAEAVHSFTNPNSGSDPSKGMAYNAAADKRSWADMLQFFGRVLAEAK